MKNIKKILHFAFCTKMSLCSLFLVLCSMTTIQAQSLGVQLYHAGQYEAAATYFQEQLESSTNARDRAEACYYIGNCLLNTGQNVEANDFFEKGILEDATYPYNNIGKIGTTILTTDPKAAENIFKNLMTTHAKDMDIYLAIARAYISQKDYKNANKYLGLGINKVANNGLPYLLKGDISMLQNKSMEAVSLYEQAMYFSPDLYPAYTKYATIYMKLNKSFALQTLQNAIEEAINRGDKFHVSDLLLAEVYQSEGKFADAIASYAKFIDDGYCSEKNYLDYALCLYMDKQYEKVSAVINPLLEKNPNNFVAKRLKAYTKAKTESGNERFSDIQNFVANAPKEQLIALDYITLGEKLNENKYYVEAAESYKSAIALDSNKRYLYQDVAEAYSKAKDIDSAAKYYDKNAELEGKDDLTVLFRYGRSLYSMTSALDSTMREKQLHYLLKADTIFSMFSEIAPDNYLGYFWRARVNSLIDSETILGLARPYYEKVVEISLPDADKRKRELSESYRYLGYYYYVQADNKAAANKNNVKVAKTEYLQAREYFSKVLEIDPNNDIAQQVIDAIDKLKF